MSSTDKQGLSVPFSLQHHSILLTTVGSDYCLDLSPQPHGRATQFRDITSTRLVCPEFRTIQSSRHLSAGSWALSTPSGVGPRGSAAPRFQRQCGWNPGELLELACPAQGQLIHLHLAETE